MKIINLPLTDKTIRALKAGDEVLLSGVIYTARDQAHKRLTELLKNKKRLPVCLKNETIYYTGPTACPKNKIIGSCGPTTSSRMDMFTPGLLKAGLKGMIGKGKRSDYIKNSIKKYGAIYFVTIAGAGALLSKKVLGKELMAFGDLGPEGIYKLEIQDFPAIVAIDSRGKSIY